MLYKVRCPKYTMSIDIGASSFEEAAKTYVIIKHELAEQSFFPWGDILVEVTDPISGDVFNYKVNWGIEYHVEELDE